MNIKAYLEALKDDTRRVEFASRCGVSLASMRNLIYGKAPGPRLATVIERESRKKVTRRELRSDWAEIWPELVTKKHPAPKGKA